MIKKYMKYNIFYITAILPTSTGNLGYHFGVSSTLFEYYFKELYTKHAVLQSDVFYFTFCQSEFLCVHL